MKKVILITLAVLFTLSAGLANAQDVQDDAAEQKAPVASAEEKAAREKTEALAMQMLRQTASEIQTLRTPENRISLSAGLVEIMWAHDPDGAREMFRGLANSFVQLFSEYSANLNAASLAEGPERYVGRMESARATSRMEKALAVRENLARAAAGMDPILALEFVKTSSMAVSGGAFSDRLKDSDSRLKVVIAESYGAADPKISKEVGDWLVKDGLTEGAIAHLKQLRSKEGNQGAEYAAEVFTAASKDLNRAKPDYGAQASLLSYAEEVFSSDDQETKKSFVSRGEVVFQAEAFGRALLRQAEVGEDEASSYAAAIRPFSETMADRVMKKFSDTEETVSPETARLLKMLEESRAKDEKRMAPSTPAAASEDEMAQMLGVGNEKDSESDDVLSKLNEMPEGEATDEVRQEMADKARAAAADLDLPVMKIGVLTTVASQLKALGDDARAMELVDEADGLVTNQPRNYQDFLEVWVLAGGMVKVAPERSFTRLEDAIFRINDVINAGITIAEFIDVNSDIVQDGELLVGAFAGGVTSGLSSMLAQSDSVLLGLARADFERAKLLTERLDKPEIRILAKTLLLGVVLNKDSGNKRTGMDFLLGQ